MERQRRRRTVRLFWSDNPETGILSSRVGPVSFGQVRQALDKHADLLRREDSGGEIRSDDIRANDQRRADALVELITGRRARTLEPLSDRRVGESPAQLVVVVADWGQDRRVPSRWGVRNTGRRARPALGSGPPFARLFRVRDHLRGQRPRVAAGTQPATGQRGPTPGRPRCGTGGACGATPLFIKPSWRRLRDWYDGGPADIDNLVSLCGPRHRGIGERNRELVKIGNRWQTRPRRLPRPGRSDPRPRRAPLMGDAPRPGREDGKVMGRRGRFGGGRGGSDLTNWGGG